MNHAETKAQILAACMARTAAQEQERRNLEQRKRRAKLDERSAAYLNWLDRRTKGAAQRPRKERHDRP